MENGGKGVTRETKSGRNLPASFNIGQWIPDMSPETSPEWLPDGWTAVAKTTRSGATLWVNPSHLLSRFSISLLLCALSYCSCKNCFLQGL